MCGIVGMVVKSSTGFTKYTEDAFYQMLWADTLRGDDSTGVVYVHQDASFGIMKDVGPATVVASEIQDHVAMKPMWNYGKALIGHNRKKTVGKVSAHTAHPFVVDNTFAMVHNGTLIGHEKLAKTEVDSEALAIHLSKVLGKDHSKEKFEEAVGKVFGAYAIAAYDQESHRIYLTRNAERPLYILDTPTCIMWASEAYMILWIASRCNIDFKDCLVTPVKAHELITIDLETNAVTREDYVPKKATVATTQTTTTKATTAKTFSLGGAHNSRRLSKSAFKAIKRSQIGRRITMYATEYVEREFPKTIWEGASEIYLIGDTEDYNFPHIVRGLVDVNELVNSHFSVVDEYYTGEIADMSYEHVSGFVTLHLTDVKPLPKSKDTKNETATDTLTLH